MRARAYPAENPASVPAPESITQGYLYLLGSASRGIRGQYFEVQEPKAQR
jgi:hypothetical protein